MLKNSKKIQVHDLSSVIRVKSPCEASAPEVTVASASHSYRDWDLWFHGTDVAFETSPKMDDAFGFSSWSCRQSDQAGSYSCCQIAIAGSHEVNTILISTTLSFKLAVALHVVTQQVSSTLKFFSPF